MKIILIMTCALTVLIPVTGAHEFDTPHISVYGTATKKIVPDEMAWSLVVRNKANAVDLVASEHMQAVQPVLRFLKNAGIAEEDIQTSNMHFEENWERRGGDRVQEGYYAATDISFRLKNLDQYRTLWLGLSKYSSLSVESVYYDHSQRIALRNETREKALLAAKEKAVAMAKALSAQLGEPLLIEENPSGTRSWDPASNTLAYAPEVSDEGGDDIAPGRISIHARVKVVFRLMSFGR